MMNVKQTYAIWFDIPLTIHETRMFLGNINYIVDSGIGIIQDFPLGNGRSTWKFQHA